MKYFVYKSQGNGLSKYNWELHRMDELSLFINEGDQLRHLFEWSDEIESVRIWRSFQDIVDITTEEEWIMEVLKG